LQAEQQYVTSTTNVSLNLVQLFKALGRRLGANLPEFARYQEARHFLGLERISRKTTIELRSFGNPKIDWIPIAEPISIFWNCIR
jgi:hypothetical protein